MIGSVPHPVFTHLLHLTDHRATFEHARFAEPRHEHGYCSDDMARVLIVASLDTCSSNALNILARKAIAFLNGALAPDGACRNRKDVSGRWTDLPTTHDHWGRTIRALGTAAAHSDVGVIRKLAVIQFERAVQNRSPHARAMAFAAIGAAELASVQPRHAGAHRFLSDYAASLCKPVVSTRWLWPEPRLTYANAVLAEAMIAVGVVLEVPAIRNRGLDMLEWLLDVETVGGHLSPTPVGGRGPHDHGPAFDQQPIEISSLADACARAAATDGREIWSDGIRLTAAWFDGDNDLGLPMWDPETGGGYDGLHADRVNLNQGAESTLAAISTMQHAQRHALVPR